MKVIVSVTNDLTTDNRVDKVCRSLTALGWEVVLVGRLLPNSLPLNRSYRTRRMRLFFKKGALFYAEFNFRLFWLLLFSKADVFHSNDLDTLLANGLAARLRSKKLVYDTHEYFLGTPEIQERPRVKATWKFIEKCFFQQPVAIFTVNHSIAGLYREDYGRTLQVMRNIPEAGQQLLRRTRAELRLPEDQFIMVLQGSGINVDRGAEEFLMALELLDDSFLWIIVGHGDVVPMLEKRSAANPNLQNRVRFLPKMPYAQMMQYTMAADLGLTLDKPTNINYLYSLPNKIFDYIRAGIPVLASKLPEIVNVVETYKVGFVFPDHQPETIAEMLQKIRSDRAALAKASENTAVAREELAWENEVKALEALYRSFD
ncbi:MAG: glycosyltransferase family 4 protein [Bacteroidota bacterium]